MHLAVGLSFKEIFLVYSSSTNPLISSFPSFFLWVITYSPLANIGFSFISSTFAAKLLVKFKAGVFRNLSFPFEICSCILYWLPIILFFFILGLYYWKASPLCIHIGFFPSGFSIDFLRRLQSHLIKDLLNSKQTWLVIFVTPSIWNYHLKIYWRELKYCLS